jgi:carbonic anhydrase
MDKIAKGVLKFQKEGFPQRKALFGELATGQSPRALFITCSDSRIDPSLITSTDPGELFIVRNAGNIVPPLSLSGGGTTATIEYALAALKVKHIVVCGHTQCGAMAGAMAPESTEGLPYVRDWLAYASAARQVVEAKAKGASEEDRMQMMIEENVLLQIQHLKTHPYVAAAMATGSVAIHGWVYDIKTGAVSAWDEAEGRFGPVDEAYAEKFTEIAKRVGGHVKA